MNLVCHDVMSAVCPVSIHPILLQFLVTRSVRAVMDVSLQAFLTLAYTSIGASLDVSSGSLQVLSANCYLCLNPRSVLPLVSRNSHDTPLSLTSVLL